MGFGSRGLVILGFANSQRPVAEALTHNSNQIPKPSSPNIRKSQYPEALHDSTSSTYELDSAP